MGRARRGQAELLAVMAMALVLAVLVGAVVRFAVLYRQASSQLEERAREVYQVVLSGGLRGYVDTSTNTVYLSSGVPLTVYAVYVHNGTTALWGSLPAPTYPSYTTSQTPLLYLTNSYAPVYQGPLAAQVNTCSAWVVVVTDKGLFKWCPTYLFRTVLALETPMNPLGSFRSYYAGNSSLIYVSYRAGGSSTYPSGGAFTSLTPVFHPVVGLYLDPLEVSESWSGSRVNITFRNPVTGRRASAVVDAATGQVVSVNRGDAALGSSEYSLVLLARRVRVLDVYLSTIIAAEVASAYLRLYALDGVPFALLALRVSLVGSTYRVCAVEVFTSAQACLSYGQRTDLQVSQVSDSYGTSQYGYADFGNALLSAWVAYRCYGFDSWSRTCRVYVLNTTVRANQLGLGLVSLYTWYGTLTSVSVAAHDHFTSAVYRSTDSRAFTAVQGSLASTAPPVRVVATDTAGTAANTAVSSPSWSYSRQVSYGSAGWWVSHLSSQRVAVRPGVSVTVESYTEAVLESPPSATPTATPATATQTATPARLSAWYVRVTPKPESPEPTDVKVLVFTTDQIDPADYSIHYTIYDEDGGTRSSGTVTPQPVYEGGRLIGYGYEWELKGDSRKSIYIVVLYKDQDFMTATRWNYLK